MQRDIFESNPVLPHLYKPYKDLVYLRLPAESADCYRNCLALADEKELHSIAFCFISTGEFRFPQDRAADIAVRTVREYLDAHPSTTLSAIIFNVFKDADLHLYQHLLGYT